MLRSSPEAFAKCPTRKLCGNIEEATFMEDSECARFNRSVMEAENRYEDLIAVMQQLLSENEMEILNDALQCYGRHPEDHSYDGEIDDIRNLANAFDEHGYNYILPEYDILRRRNL